MQQLEPHVPLLHPKKRLPALLSVLVLLVLLSPVVENFKNKPVDSFPLSHFPMFSAKRTDTYTGSALVGLNEHGRPTRLRYKLAGTGGFNQVRRQIRAKVKDGRAAEVCETVAAKLARSSRKSSGDIRTVQVVTATHKVDAFFARDETPLKQKVHASCAVPEAKEIAANHKEKR